MTTSVSRAWARIEKWLEANAAPIFHNLADGASEDELAALQRALGDELCPELVESLRRHNGQKSELPAGLIGGWELLSTAGIAEQWRIWKQLLDAGEIAGESTPADSRIKPVWWSPRWIPVTHSGSGNHHCVDMDPGPGGERGQVLVLWHDDGSRPLVAGSYTAWLEGIADGLETGRLQVFEEYGDWVLEPGGFLVDIE